MAGVGPALVRVARRVFPLSGVHINTGSVYNQLIKVVTGGERMG